MRGSVSGSGDINVFFVSREIMIHGTARGGPTFFGAIGLGPTTLSRSGDDEGDEDGDDGGTFRRALCQRGRQQYLCGPSFGPR